MPTTAKGAADAGGGERRKTATTEAANAMTDADHGGEVAQRVLARVGFLARTDSLESKGLRVRQAGTRGLHASGGGSRGALRPRQAGACWSPSSSCVRVAS